MNFNGYAHHEIFETSKPICFQRTQECRQRTENEREIERVKAKCKTLYPNMTQSAFERLATALQYIIK